MAKANELEAALKLASRQHGALTFSQARTRGLTQRVVSRLVATSRLIRVFEGVYRVAGGPQTRAQELRLAALWAGDDAAFSHHTAGEIWRLHGVPKKAGVDVLTGKTTRTPGRAAWFEVRTHRARDFDSAKHRRKIDRLWVTDPLTTLFDLATVLKAKELELALLDLLRRELVDLKELQLKLRRMKGKGLQNIGILRDLAEADHVDANDSELESLTVQMIADAGLPAPRPRFELFLGDAYFGRFDFGYADQRVVIECDGRRHHDRVKAGESDRTKSNRLAAVGWRLLRFTKTLVTRERKQTVQILRDTLATPLGSRGLPAVEGPPGFVPPADFDLAMLEDPRESAPPRKRRNRGPQLRPRGK